MKRLPKLERARLRRLAKLQPLPGGGVQKSDTLRRRAIVVWVGIVLGFIALALTIRSCA